MAEFFIRNSLNPSKVVSCGITYRQLVPKGNEGEAVWVIELATRETDTNGDAIPSEYIYLTSLEYLQEEIDAAAARIAAKVDWTPLANDGSAPYVDSISPAEYEIPIDSTLEIVLKELLPATGIDINSIEMTIDGHDVTGELEITGDPYEYKLKWHPSIIVKE